MTPVTTIKFMQIRGCRHVNVNEIVCVSDFRFDADKNVYKQTI